LRDAPRHDGERVSGQQRRPRFLLIPLLLLATIPLSRLDPSSGSHAAGVRPLSADFHVSIGPMLVVPIALGILLWLAFPRMSELSDRAFLASAVAFGWAFAMTLAVEGSFGALTARFAQAGNYWSQVPVVERLGPRAFAAAYPDLFVSQNPLTHAAVHPPGALLSLWALSRLTGESIGLVCATVVLIGCLGAVPTYFIARRAYGERAARWASLLFVCCPGILLYAVSMDAVFVTVTAIALVALLQAPRSDAWAFGAGLFTTVALCFTFGALALAPLFLGILLMARKDAPTGVLARRAALVGAGVIVAAVAVRASLSIDLIADLRSVIKAQSLFDQLGGRPYRYWVWADAAAFFLSAGTGLTALFAAEVVVRWRRRSPGLEAALLGTIVLFSVSGLNRGETDRIWLLFVPVLCAAAASSAREVEVRWVAAAGLAQALVIQCLLLVWGR
jgi:methylthioxylose transferase